jgi:dihydrofolate reductase
VIGRDAYFPRNAWDGGGATGPDDDIAAEYFQNIWATIMGRHMFGGGDGPWEDHPWNGWWGENPPFHMPVFVLTHHARDSTEMQGGTTFHFVTEGIHAALQRVRDVGQGKDIILGGGANVAQPNTAVRLLPVIDVDPKVYTLDCMTFDSETQNDSTGNDYIALDLKFWSG